MQLFNPLLSNQLGDLLASLWQGCWDIIDTLNQCHIVHHRSTHQHRCFILLMSKIDMIVHIAYKLGNAVALLRTDDVNKRMWILCQFFMSRFGSTDIHIPINQGRIYRNKTIFACFVKFIRQRCFTAGSRCYKANHVLFIGCYHSLFWGLLRLLGIR